MGLSPISGRLDYTPSVGMRQQRARRGRASNLLPLWPEVQFWPLAIPWFKTYAGGRASSMSSCTTCSAQACRERKPSRLAARRARR